jgi:NADH:ubiquinone oxidoreductase subunit 4 (subunit M)
VLWQGTPPRPESPVQPVTMGDATAHESVVTAPLVLATVALGLVPGPLLALTAPVVRTLLGAEAP